MSTQDQNKKPKQDPSKKTSGPTSKTNGPKSTVKKDTKDTDRKK